MTCVRGSAESHAPVGGASATPSPPPAAGPAGPGDAAPQARKVCGRLAACPCPAPPLGAAWRSLAPALSSRHGCWPPGQRGPGPLPGTWLPPGRPPPGSPPLRGCERHFLRRRPPASGLDSVPLAGAAPRWPPLKRSFSLPDHLGFGRACPLSPAPPGPRGALRAPLRTTDSGVTPPSPDCPHQSVSPPRGLGGGARTQAGEGRGRPPWTRGRRGLGLQAECGRRLLTGAVPPRRRSAGRPARGRCSAGTCRGDEQGRSERSSGQAAAGGTLASATEGRPVGGSSWRRQGGDAGGCVGGRGPGPGVQEAAGGPVGRGPARGQNSGSPLESSAVTLDVILRWWLSRIELRMKLRLRAACGHAVWAVFQIARPKPR